MTRLKNESQSVYSYELSNGTESPFKSRKFNNLPTDMRNDLEPLSVISKAGIGQLPRKQRLQKESFSRDHFHSWEEPPDVSVKLHR